MIRELLSFMPSNNLEDPPRRDCSDPIDREDEALDSAGSRRIQSALRH